MGKKRREKKEQQQRQRELKARINIKRTLREMKNQSIKLSKFKQTYIEKARNATKIGNEQTYKMAKSGLKICLSKQKYLDSMIINFELAMETNDMNKVIGSFVDGISIISNQMESFSSSVDLTKAQQAFDQAMTNNLSQYEALDAFISTAVDSFDSMEMVGDSIDDDEIDGLITNQTVDEESNLDKEIEEKISGIKDKLVNSGG